MEVVQAPSRSLAADVLSRWVGSLGAALASGDAAGAAGLFAADGYWRDILALGWSYRTFAGRAEIEGALRNTAAAARPRDFRLAPDRMPPRTVRRGGRDVIEGFVDFVTSAGKGTAFVRLLDEQTPAAWMVLTTLQELHGHEESVGARRPSWSTPTTSPATTGSTSVARRRPTLTMTQRCSSWVAGRPAWRSPHGWAGSA